MCDPATAAIVLTVASTGANLYTTRQNAKAQERAFREAQATEEEQILDQASVEANERARLARAERARLRAQSAESGAAGLSIDEVLNDVDFQAGIDLANMATNQRNRVNASRTNLGSNLAGIKQPDYLGETLNAGLRIATMQQKPGG